MELVDVEFYAELPNRNLQFPQSLEDHYGLFFEDRPQFAEILRDDDLFFDI